MDRENALAPGWSHVVSDADDLAELEEFRVRVGAPPRALQFGDGHRPHLDLKLEPRDRALQDPGVRVFQRTRDLILHLRTLAAGATR